MASYPGGKAGDGVFQKIINLMPPHQIYIEPFLGGGAIMRQKQPAPVSSIGIDIDASAVNSFAAIARTYSPPIPDLRLYVGDSLESLTSFWLEKWIRPETLMYLDPPYLMETRSCKKPYYRHELATTEEHERLLRIILDLPCMVMISGYYSHLYSSTLAGWRQVSFQAQTRGGPAEEFVWLNFPAPLELHDYRYLGGNFRERERIKRKQLRWKNRLERMDDQERYAMLSVLQDLRSTSPNLTMPAERASIVNPDESTR